MVLRKPRPTPLEDTMLPDPLHPAVVHFPVVLMLLLPLVAAGALVAIRRGTTPLRAWAFPLACGAALTLSAWVSVETGESQEERVETVVPEGALDTHAQAADRFLVLSGGLLLLMGAGLAPGRTGSVARGLGAVAALGLTVAGYQVGHSGGQLVYRYGAASAYSGGAAATGERFPARERSGSVAGQKEGGER
jgi:hypothetical protein